MNIKFSLLTLALFSVNIYSSDLANIENKSQRDLNEKLRRDIKGFRRFVRTQTISPQVTFKYADNGDEVSALDKALVSGIFHKDQQARSCKYRNWDDIISVYFEITKKHGMLQHVLIGISTKDSDKGCTISLPNAN